MRLREARISAQNLATNAAAAVGNGCRLADVSADGYGHGGARVATLAMLAGFDSVYVAGVDEAIRLRHAGFGGDIRTDAVPKWRRHDAREARIGELGGDRAIIARDALYGFDGVSASTLRLSARALSVKTINRGDGVSYGYTFRATERGSTALIAIGYGDGIHRRAGNRATVRLAGADRPIIGRVAMNVFVVWLGDDLAAIGDEAVLFGDPRRGEPRVQDWAAQVQDHPAVVTATLGPRVIRSTR